jgi:hypothetical protein
MVTFPIPYGFCDVPKQWASTLNKILELDADYFIPGHGESLVSREYITTIADVLNTTANQFEQLKTQDLSEDDIIKRVDINEYIGFFTRNDPITLYRFNEWYLKPIIRRLNKF